MCKLSDLLGSIADIVFFFILQLGHRVPKVSSIYWGICLPSSCSASDLQTTLKYHLQALIQNIHVDEKMTVTIEDNIPYSTGKTFTV